MEETREVAYHYNAMMRVIADIKHHYEMPKDSKLMLELEKAIGLYTDAEIALHVKRTEDRYK